LATVSKVDAILLSPDQPLAVHEIGSSVAKWYDDVRRFSARRQDAA